MRAITILVLISISLVISGCDIIAPHISQAQSLERQTKALERIANALEHK